MNSRNPSRSRRWLRPGRRAASLALLVSLAILPACSITQPDPDKAQFGVMLPKAPASTSPTGLSCLRVERVNIAPPFNQMSFTYRIGDNQFETDYYNEFVSPPDRLLTGATMQALTERAAATTVLDPSSTAGCSLRLETSITDLYADLRTGKNQAVIRARFMLLRDQAGATTIVGDWPIEAAEKLLSPSPPDIAAGFGRAYAAMMNRLVKELAASKQ